jgi:hypothetical protein
MGGSAQPVAESPRFSFGIFSAVTHKDGHGDDSGMFLFGPCNICAMSASSEILFSPGHTGTNAAGIDCDPSAMQIKRR